MNLLEGVPESVEVKGERYPIYTDFRDWINFERLLRDDSLTTEVKAAVMLDFYVDRLPPPCPEALSGLLDFFSGENRPVGGPSPKRVFDMEKDYSMVYSGFVQTYSINLNQIDYLHWWEFKALLDGLPEDTRLSKAMGYRAVDISKVPKGQREQYRELQKIYSLEPLGKVSATPKTAEDRKKELISLVRAARQRAQMDKMP